jgi:pyruvate dehydrogenase E2 component (dihydrolipoamide acetyltransferase)
MTITVTMPALSPTMTEGKLAKWLVKEGDKITAGKVIAEIETDKATMEVEAVDEGTLGKILIPEGAENVAVNTPIALILEEGETASALSGAAAAKSTPAPAVVIATATPPAAAASGPRPTAAPAPATQGGDRVIASPLARRMAQQAGLDLAGISGSGPNGRIIKIDIDAALAKGPSPAREAPAPARAPGPSAPPPAPTGAEYEDIPLNNFRKVAAKRLTEAKQTIPHIYLTVDCEIDALMKMRADLNGRAPKDGYKLSVNDFVIRACALALKQRPAINASWTETAIRRWKTVDVAVAVSLPEGLITPIIRNADHKGLAAISGEMKELAKRARDGKLKLNEFQGGGFTISNLGMFGIKDFAAVINPPHGAILAVGAGEQRPVVKNGALAVATVMTLTLSCDHRLIDGAVGAEFLGVVKRLIEDPLTMLL